MFILFKCFWRVHQDFFPWPFPSIISSPLVYLQPGSHPHSPCQPFRHVPCGCFVFFLFDFTGNKILWDCEQALNSSYFVVMSKKVWSNRGGKKRKIRTARSVELPGNNFPPLCELAFIRLQWGHLERLQQKKLVCTHIGEQYEQWKEEKFMWRKREKCVGKRKWPSHFRLQAVLLTWFY